MVVDEVDFYNLSPEIIVKYLPGKDCRNCKYESCLEFAKVLSEGKVLAKDCPEMALTMTKSLAGALSIKLEVHEADASMSTSADGLVELNSPIESSPVLITGNSGVTIKVLKLIFSNTPDASAFLIPTDTKGFTIDHAAGMRLVTPMTVMRGLTNSAVALRVDHHRMIIPGLCAGIEKQLEQMTRWTVEVGPISGFELPAFIIERMKNH
jgi:acetyl-CoA decarbonylase/synthase complex subunit gamma